jgi:hypothetical protein
VGGYYCIYAFYKGDRYQIVSKKEPIKHAEKGEEVKVEGCYNFILSQPIGGIVINDTTVFPSNYREIGYTQEDGTVIFFGSGITYLHYALNVKDIYLIKK